MKTRLLMVIGLILVGIGLILTMHMIYHSHQMYVEHTSDFSDSEQSSIAIIGATISVSWYFPFFIAAFVLFRKSKKLQDTRK